MATWKEHVVWQAPHSIHELVHGPQGRRVIPTDRGFYAFVDGATRPSPDRCLYVGIAAGKTGLYGRLGSYLRTSVTVGKASSMKHQGKKRLSFARIRGVDATGTAAANTPVNDKSIHVCWAIAPFDFDSASKGKNEREFAYMLERALIDFYRPLYNTADWDRYNDFDLEDDAGF